jgi:ABC-2 type transport system permease protein
MRALTAFWNILKKDMRNYYLKPPNISWGIIFPVAWTLMFFVKSSSPIDVRSLLPGVIVLSILFGTTSMLAVTITFERRSRSFERLLLAPISLTQLMLAKTTGAILFGIFNAFVPVFFASFLTSLADIHWAPLALGVALTAIASTFLGLFVAVSVSEVFEAQTFSNFFRFPMIFLCGLFIPVQRLPKFLQPVSFILPPTYGVDMIRPAIEGGSGMLSFAADLALLLVIISVLFTWSLYNVRRRWMQ